MNESNLDISFSTADGKKACLRDFDAKVYLLVNVASKCGLTSQYEKLEKLFKKYKDKGILVVGFPANEFLSQEPGTDTEIQEFCQLNYGVSFPVVSKIVVKGEGIHPLYEALIHQKKQATKNKSSDLEERLSSKGLITGEDHEIHWNFEKFLLDKKGKVVERFFPDVDPMDGQLIQKLESLLEH
jgi:glutathione peroxidase